MGFPTAKRANYSKKKNKEPMLFELQTGAKILSISDKKISLCVSVVGYSTDKQLGTMVHTLGKLITSLLASSLRAHSK